MGFSSRYPRFQGRGGMSSFRPQGSGGPPPMNFMPRPRIGPRGPGMGGANPGMLSSLLNAGAGNTGFSGGGPARPIGFSTGNMPMNPNGTNNAQGFASQPTPLGNAQSAFSNLKRRMGTGGLG